jgi:hypothetical protein
MESARNLFFETIGLDRRSVNYMDELSVHVGQRASRYVDQQDLAFPQPILLRLRPEAYANFEGDHRLQLGDQSAVQLDLRWDGRLTLERTCHLLAKALLLQYTVYNFGPGTAPTMHAWPVAALATDAYLGLRSAEALRMRQNLRAEAGVTADSIFRIRLADGAAPAASAYYMLQSFEALSPDRRYARRFFKQGLSGIDVGEPLAILLKKAVPEGAVMPVGMWWAEQKRAILARPLEAFESMEASREWLAAIADLSAAGTGAEDASINLRTLRNYQDATAVRELIAARYEILRLRLPRCNPAFFNAAQSLGALFEIFLSDGPSHKYVHALVIYLSDWEDAKEMEEAIDRKLSDL